MQNLLTVVSFEKIQSRDDWVGFEQLLTAGLEHKLCAGLARLDLRLLTYYMESFCCPSCNGSTLASVWRLAIGET
jgi:hypothetical protein